MSQCVRLKFLGALPFEPAETAQAIAAARETFESLETWLCGRMYGPLQATFRTVSATRNSLSPVHHAFRPTLQPEYLKSPSACDQLQGRRPRSLYILRRHI